MKPTVFIVDDDDMFARLLSANLGRAGEFRTRVFVDAAEAIEAVHRDPPQAVLTDLMMPDIDGVRLTERLRPRHPNLPIFVLTAYGKMDTAIEALKAGADEYLTKPVDVDDLAALLRQAISRTSRLDDYDRIRAETRERFTTRAILGEHPLVEEVRRFVESVARVDGATVLLLGETGTGKNLVARAIHAAGSRADRPFVELNCAAVPASLLEAELFGHVRGAFTDAREAKRGLFQAADGGVLFLDEIGDMPLDFQAKLLNVLESRRLRRLGSTAEVEVDVQVVAATNLDLAAEVEAGRFRSDLYYRINVVCHRLPALREIASDIPLIARHLLGELAADFRKDAVDFEPEALEALASWRWPGNVRELRNVVERAVIFATGELVRTRDLPAFRSGPAPPSPGPSPPDGAVPIPADLTLKEVEREYIKRTLERNDGDIQRSAESLGISRKSLWERRKRHGLP